MDDGDGDPGGMADGAGWGAGGGAETRPSGPGRPVWFPWSTPPQGRSGEPGRDRSPFGYAW